MKNKNPNIDLEIKQTMNLLDNLPKVHARYGFYDRLHYRMEKENTVVSTVPATPLLKIIRHAITPAIVSAGIIIGVFIGLGVQPTTDNASLETVIETYGISVPGVQNYFNIETN